MKKINKSLPPNPLTEFAQANPNATWNDFYRTARQSYDDLKQQMLIEQGGLCAYCEKKLSDNITQQRIEHFHNKSDRTTNHNWALDWENILLVCLGGATKEDKGKYAPEHLSCDAHKEQIKELPEACEGWYLNPYQIKTIAQLFDFDRATRKLVVNHKACQELENDNLPNHYGSDWVKLAEETIRILNLNSPRLCKDRERVMFEYDKRIKQYRQRFGKEVFYKISEREFSKKFPEFFSTWRSLLGEHAEEYLTAIHYNG